MSRNHQSFYERLDRDLARLDRLKSTDRGVVESLLFYLLGYIEGFHEAGAISGNECGRLIQRARAAAVVSVKPEVSANEKPEPVPAPATPRGLRLLCVLVPARDGSTRSLPVHTLHRVPPRVGPKGRWLLEADACLHLRETHPQQPTAQVLARCARHRQANPFRAPARTVRTGGVSA